MMDNKKTVVDHGRRFLVKAFNKWTSITTAIHTIRDMDDASFDVSILEKVDDTCARNGNVSAVKQKWETLMGTPMDFGFFANPKIGNVCVSGPASRVFLQEVGDKNLGALSEGPYGILRGLGISDLETKDVIYKLDHCQYVLLLRVPKKDVASIDALLQNLNPMDRTG